MDIKHSIVKIYTKSIEADYEYPWNILRRSSWTGSGCIIAGERILTNAHVVSNHTHVQVRRNGQAKKWIAKVLHVSHDADLAVLTVEDSAFFTASYLEFGGLPELQSDVFVYGYPKGGDTLSVTKGVVSRVEHQPYVHSSLNFLAAQIDAAINPGNSGGPAIVDGEIVGVVMQSAWDSENIGYIAPTPIIEHFLKDIEDGAYDGFPALGVRVQQLNNPGHREMYGMGEGESGVLISQISPLSPAKGKLKVKDVITAIDGHSIADDKTVEFRKDERTDFRHFVDLHHIGDYVRFDVLRKAKPLSVRFKLNKSLDDLYIVPMERYDAQPNYYIFGGLVFSKLTKDYLNEWEDISYAPSHFREKYSHGHKHRKEDEVVIITNVLATDMNEGYHDVENWIITKVNGKNVRNLKELIALIEGRTNGSGFITFENTNGLEIVIDRAKAVGEKEKLLKKYRIPFDRSPDLM